MKIILISIIFLLAFFSDLLVLTNTNNTNLCVSDDYIESFKNITFIFLPDYVSTKIRKTNIVEIKSGYIYDSNSATCKLINTNPLTPDENGFDYGNARNSFSFSYGFMGYLFKFLISIGLIISFRWLFMEFLILLYLKL